MFTITIRWPHEGIVVGYEMFSPTEQYNYYTFRLHLVMISVDYEWGDDNNDYI